MRYFRYKIVDDEIESLIGEVKSIPSDFIELTSGLGWQSVYYLIKNGKITDVIGEAVTEEAARRRVEEFISSLNVNVF